MQHGVAFVVPSVDIGSEFLNKVSDDAQTRFRYIVGSLKVLLHAGCGLQRRTAVRGSDGRIGSRSYKQLHGIKIICLSGSPQSGGSGGIRAGAVTERPEPGFGCQASIGTRPVREKLFN